MPRSLIVGFVVVLLAGGCSPSGVQILDPDGRPLNETSIKLFIDDDIRCVTTPCPSSAREWQGRTDDRGRFVVPQLADNEHATLYVDGFLPVAIDGPRQRVRLSLPVVELPKQKLVLRTSLRRSGNRIEIRLSNPGPDQMSVVRPDGLRLGRYGEWGGWHLLVKDRYGPFLPVPLPGPYVAASQADVMTLAVDERWDEAVRLDDWRRVGGGTNADLPQTWAAAAGRLTVRLRWSGLPAHLAAARAAPRAIASARHNRVESR